jgi:hypothetical protein
MVSAGNHESRLRHLRRYQIEGLDHEFETLVCSPFAERQNAVGGSATPREIGQLRPARKDAVRAQVDVVSSVLIFQNLAIAGHQDRN